ncbi:MAG TPA: hypothetical protein VFK56_02200 [Mycobacterium sp.]|nr:hypothetical protein [Mycobacterium sp.]
MELRARHHASGYIDDFRDQLVVNVVGYPAEMRVVWGMRLAVTSGHRFIN